jgi:class 3 adenylate cyclase
MEKSDELQSSPVSLFLPMDRRQALVAGRTLPERAVGAILLTDISGFSPLTSLLADTLGMQAGAEALIRHLDRVDGALIAEVHRLQGSVIAFAGDSITCWFEDAEGVDDACERAASCAFAMQNIMGEIAAIEVGTQRISIAIKVAIACGPVRRLLVGDPEDQVIETLAGRALDELEDAERQAKPGEVVVSAAVRRRLSEATWPEDARSADTTKGVVVLGSGAPTLDWTPWRDNPSIEPEVARGWLLPQVYERLMTGQAEFLAQLRPTVAMFLSFDGIDYDGDDEAGVKLDTYIRWVQSVLARFEGTLLQLSTGDKGSYLYIVFGALRAHEDDATRAVAASIELQNPPTSMPFRPNTRIGMSSGRLFAGAYGGSRRLAYAVLGREVNVAARLMGLAEQGETIVSDRIRQAATGFAFEDRGARMLKGHPIARWLFAVTGRTGTSRPAIVKQSSVGRDVELAFIDQQLRQLGVGGTPVVVVEGAAGIGKSVLFAALLDRVADLPVLQCAGAGDAIVQSTPWLAWRPIFRTLLGSTVDAVARVDGLAPDRAHLAPLLNAILPLGLADTELTAQMEGKVRADNTNDLLVELLRGAAAETPLLLVMEDGHWLDSASWGLLQRVTTEVEGLGVLLATRPEPVFGLEELTEILGREATHHVHLGVLGREDVGALMRAHLLVAEIPNAVLDLVMKKGEGHPHFCVAVIDAMRDARIIQVREGHCTIRSGVADFDNLDLPNTIEGVLTGRVDRLPAREQLVLKVGSVIGANFAYPLLHDIYPVEDDRTELKSRLARLTEQHLLEVDTPEPGLTHRFYHVIMQEVSYGLLLFQQRQRLHRAVAEWLERQGDDLSPFYGLLAHHWTRAARAPEFDARAAEKAVHYLDLAGRQALAAYANAEASRAFLQALDFHGQLAEFDDADARERGLARAGFHHRLAEAYRGLGDLGRCAESGRQGLAALGRPMPEGDGRLILGALGRIGARYLPPFVRGGGPKTDLDRRILRQETELYIPLARVFYHTNEPMSAVYANAHRLNQAEALGPSPELAEAQASVAITFGLFNMPARAEDYFDRALAVARTTGQSSILVTVYVIRCAYLMGGARWQEMGEMLAEGRALCEELGDHAQWGDCVGMQADAALLRGEIDQGLEIGAELRQQGQARNNHLHELWGVRGQAVTALRAGDFERAGDFLNRAMLLLEHTTDQHTRIDIHGLISVTDVHGKRYREAYDHAVAATDLIATTQVPTAYGQYMGYAGAAQTFMELAELRKAGALSDDVPDDLAARVAQAIKDLKKYAGAFAIGKPQAGRFRGLQAQRSGSLKKAHKEWTTALEHADTLQLPYEQASLHFLLGSHGESGDPAREEHLLAASKIAGRLKLSVLASDIAAAQA